MYWSIKLDCLLLFPPINRQVLIYQRKLNSARVFFQHFSSLLSNRPWEGVSGPFPCSKTPKYQILTHMDNLEDSLKKYQIVRPNTHLHSELHALVDEARALFGETATKGKGSFAFYLGFFKRLGKDRVYQILSEVKDSKTNTPGKLFWWKVKEVMKKPNTDTNTGNQ